VNGYAGFVDPEHARFFDEASRRAQAGDYSLYSLVGTRHFVMPSSTPLRGLPGVEVPPFRVYPNEGARGRAFLAVAYDGTDWSDGVIRSAAGVIVSIDESRPEHITVHAHSEADAIVVLNERWDPGWHARVDDKPAPLREIDGVLMAAEVSAGEHTVEFLYQPRGLIIGRVVSLASLAVCALLLITSLRRRRPGD
jgi:hypothetical protein